ncbi:MAG: LacI family DNA-binding transcriptional regulator [Anaerolineales bacterium]|jgi:DNA-binding LacI/PurR family transcriptional regulator|nr:LacI family DNA-binding transcriptional regulator [Anaerolineales bacterium]MCC6986487.1 LacI family DNA-binding transcriptional regulator [Anaerolineales bacterium]
MPPPKTPTIYDVARLSGVSIATISRALNSPDKVNPETRTKVMEAIDRLGFVPKAEARARALQSANRIGVITPFFTAPSFVQRLRGVAGTLSRANYELVIYPVDSVEHMQGYISSIPIMGNLDGLIIMSLAIEKTDARRLIENGMQTVLIEFSHEELNSIIINDEQGGRMVAEYLIQKGHKSLGFLGDIEPPERYAIHPVKSRLEGFKKTLEEAGVSFPKKNIKQALYSQENSRQAAYELLSMSSRPTALFAASDIQALSVMKVARQLNLRIPDDLAVIGFDDIDMADYVDLTTVRQHLDESGRLAAEMVLARIRDGSRALQHINLPLNLVERATV